VKDASTFATSTNLRDHRGAVAGRPGVDGLGGAGADDPAAARRDRLETVGRHGVGPRFLVAAASTRERGAVSAPRLDTASGTLEGLTV
jgi:hypothetical protein